MKHALKRAGLAAIGIAAASLGPNPLAHAARFVGETPASGGDAWFRSQEVGFQSGEFTLAGTILLPSGPPPHPGIVLLHGSGPHPRGHSLPFAERFAAAGIAVLAYDKRGSGESEGNWARASLRDLARDGIAAMKALASRPEVDAERVGLWGPSQGAWVATEISQMTSSVAFLIGVSGGGVSPRTVESWAYERALERHGASGEEKARARALLDDYFGYMATGEGRAGLERRIESARTEPWYEALQLHRVLPSEQNRPHWEWVAAYDPLPGISKMTFPVLLLFGEKDEQQPTDLAVARWQEGLRRAGNRRWRCRVFAGADHGIGKVPEAPAHDSPAHPEGAESDAAGRARTGGNGAEHSGGHDLPLADGFPDTAVEWLRAQTGLDPALQVRAYGSLRAIMHRGETGASATLADWTPASTLVAVGALSELRGEITAVDGRVYVARPEGDGTARTFEVDASSEDAALLVLAEVPRWIEVPIGATIPFDGLDEAIRSAAAQTGVDTSRPFPFVVAGELNDLQWHTIDGRRLEPGGGHESHLRAGVREERSRASATLIGFYSDSHQGVFTHLGSRTHVHVVVREPLSSGHVDHVAIPAGATLRLPAAE